MARSVMRLDGDELRCFHSNYLYMWKKLNTAPYYVSGFGEPPAWIHGAELLPSYVNLSKCMNPDYVPSINLVNKIVHFYNANIAPSVDTYAFLHDTLESGDRGRTAISCSDIGSYCGMYYGYYYSDSIDERYVRGVIMKIFSSGEELRANLIYDIISDEDLLSSDFKKFIEKENPRPEDFAGMRNSLPVSKRFMSMYTGGGKICPGVVSLQLQRADRDGEYMSLFIPANASQNGEFIGGLGIAFLITSGRVFQMYRMGFERIGNSDLRPLSLDDPKLLELLALNKGINERVILSPNDNSTWTSYMLLRKNI